MSEAPSQINSRSLAVKAVGKNKPSLPPRTANLRPFGRRSRIPSTLPQASVIGNVYGRCLADHPTLSLERLDRQLQLVRQSAQHFRPRHDRTQDSASLAIFLRRSRWVSWRRETFSATVPLHHLRVTGEANRLLRSLIRLDTVAYYRRWGIGWACIQAPIPFSAYPAPPMSTHAVPISAAANHRLDSLRSSIYACKSRGSYRTLRPIRTEHTSPLAVRDQSLRGEIERRRAASRIHEKPFHERPFDRFLAYAHVTLLSNGGHLQSSITTIFRVWRLVDNFFAGFRVLH